MNVQRETTSTEDVEVGLHHSGVKVLVDEDTRGQDKVEDRGHKEGRRRGKGSIDIYFH